MSIDKALAILRERTPGRWAPPDDLSEFDPWTDKADIESLGVDGDDGYPLVVADDMSPADARAIVLAVNTIEAALAVASAARDVCDPMVEDGGGDRWWSAHDALRESLAALDAAIEEET